LGWDFLYLIQHVIKENKLSLYKYTTASNAISILKTLEVRFTQAVAFNDPFDTSPLISYLYTSEEIELLFNEIIQNKLLIDNLLLEVANKEYDKLPFGLRNLIGTPEKLKEWFMQEMPKKGFSLQDGFHRLLKNTINTEETKAKILNNVIYGLRNHIGVFSLTKVHDSLLMWAHYADAHRGVVFELDEDNEFFKKHSLLNYSMDFEVIYMSQRPKVYFKVKDTTTDQMLEIVKAIAYTKSIEWRYEEEVRIIKFLDPQSYTGSNDGGGYHIHLFEIPKDIIKNIFLGCKISSEDKKIIVELLKNYQNVNIVDTKVDEKHFRLNFVPLL